MDFSDKIKQVKLSETSLMSRKARELKAEEKDVLDLSIGESSTPTHKLIIDEAKKVLDQGKTRYTDVSGINLLKEAYCNRLKEDYELVYKPEQIVITNGAKQGLYNVIISIINPGDEVICIAPHWPTFLEQVSIVGGKPVTVTTEFENKFQLTKEQLQTAVTPKTKAIIINNPCNPTGMIFEKESLTAIGEIAEEHDLWIISDEAYGKLIFNDAPFTSMPSLSPEVQARTVLISSVSKSYNMTGWRIGFVALPSMEFARHVARLNSQIITHPSSISQYSSIRALENQDDFLSTLIRDLEKKKNFLVSELNKIEGMELLDPTGTLFVFPKVTSFLNKEFNDLQFCLKLLEDHHVAITPGSVFSAPGHVRITFASSFEDLREFIDRFNNYLSSLPTI